jgi:hypothetical protein
MLYICKLSNKLDLNQAICVSHTGAQRFTRNPAPYAMYLTQIITKLLKTKTRYHFLFKQTEGCDSETSETRKHRQ